MKQSLIHIIVPYKFEKQYVIYGDFSLFFYCEAGISFKIWTTPPLVLLLPSEHYSCNPRLFLFLLFKNGGNWWQLSVCSTAYTLGQEALSFSYVVVHLFFSWLVWGRNQVNCSCSSALMAHKLLLTGSKKVLRAYCTNIYILWLVA